MGQKFRKLMAKTDGFEMQVGHVEADEAYVGTCHHGKRGRGAAGKAIVKRSSFSLIVMSGVAVTRPRM